MESVSKIFLHKDGRLRTLLQIIIVSFTFLIISTVGQAMVSSTLFKMINSGVLPGSVMESYFLSGLLPETILNFIAGGVILVWYKVINKKKLASMGVPSPLKNMKNIVLGILCITAAAVCLTGVLFLIGDIRFTGLTFIPSVLQYFLLMSSVSFVEEVLNRGYIQHLVKSRYKAFWSLVIPSLVFMLFHVKNTGVGVVGLTNIFLAGFFFSVVTHKTKNIWFGFGTHMMWNAGLACVFGLMQVSAVTGSIINVEYTRKTLFNGYAATPLNGIIGTVMWVILIVIFGCFIFNNKRKADAR